MPKTKSHDPKAMRKILRKLIDNKFEVKQLKSGTYKIIPPNNGPVYHTHGTNSCIPVLRREFKKLYDIDL